MQIKMSDYNRVSVGPVAEQRMLAETRQCAEIALPASASALTAEGLPTRCVLSAAPRVRRFDHGAENSHCSKRVTLELYSEGPNST